MCSRRRERPARPPGVEVGRRPDRADGVCTAVVPRWCRRLGASAQRASEPPGAADRNDTPGTLARARHGVQTARDDSAVESGGCCARPTRSTSTRPPSPGAPDDARTRPRRPELLTTRRDLGAELAPVARPRSAGSATPWSSGPSTPGASNASPARSTRPARSPRSTPPRVGASAAACARSAGRRGSTSTTPDASPSSRTCWCASGVCSKRSAGRVLEALGRRAARGAGTATRAGPASWCATSPAPPVVTFAPGVACTAAHRRDRARPTDGAAPSKRSREAGRRSPRGERTPDDRRRYPQERPSRRPGTWSTSSRASTVGNRGRGRLPARPRARPLRRRAAPGRATSRGRWTRSPRGAILFED